MVGLRKDRGDRGRRHGHDDSEHGTDQRIGERNHLQYEERYQGIDDEAQQGCRVRVPVLQKLKAVPRCQCHPCYEHGKRRGDVGKMGDRR